MYVYIGALLNRFGSFFNCTFSIVLVRIVSTSVTYILHVKVRHSCLRGTAIDLTNDEASMPPDMGSTNAEMSSPPRKKNAKGNSDDDKQIERTGLPSLRDLSYPSLQPENVRECEPLVAASLPASSSRPSPVLPTCFRNQ